MLHKHVSLPQESLSMSNFWEDLWALENTTVYVTKSANKYLRNKHAQTSSPSSRVLASTGSDTLPSLRALESCPVKAVMVIEYRVNAVRFPTTNVLISSEYRTKLMLYPEPSNWKRTKRNWSRNCQKVNRWTRYLKFMNSQQWCQWCMRWALRWPMVHPTQSLIQWQKEPLRCHQEGYQGLRQKGRDKELGLFLSYMYVTILLLKSSGDLMNVPSKLHVCTAMILLPRRPKNTLCIRQIIKNVWNMLILRCLKSKLMDWAVLQQQSIDFQYGTKTVRTQLWFTGSLNKIPAEIS